MSELALPTGSSGVRPVAEAVRAGIEQHRRELTAYCYRMLGSTFDAEDAVQETLTRAWRNAHGFEGRASVRTWLYRIATNVCLDQLRGSQRRARPMDLGPASTVATATLATSPEQRWLQPVPDARVSAATSDPAEALATRESLRLALVAALQHLPPRQRAVLLLREVLRWHADEVAALLETSVASVNSALQRARATLAERAPADTDVYDPLDDAQQALLSRYVEAFEAYDMDGLTTLLHEDASQSMPPYDLWLQGADEMVAWMLGPGAGCRGSRLVPTVANGSPAFAQYRASGPGGRHEPWALQVLEIADGRIARMTFFLDTPRIFPLFDLPAHPDG